MKRSDFIKTAALFLFAALLAGCTSFGTSGYGNELKPAGIPDHYRATVYYGAFTPLQKQSRPTAIKKADAFLAEHPEYKRYEFVGEPRQQMIPSAWVFTVHFIR